MYWFILKSSKQAPLLRSQNLAAALAVVILIASSFANGLAAFAQQEAMAAQKDGKGRDAKALADKKKHEATAVTQFEIDAPREQVWKALTDFPSYPDVFKRIRSCKVTKQEGDLVYTESFLKPQMFLKQPCQHTVNDLSGKPAQLTWRLIDGNFKSVSGEWLLKPIENDTRCQVVYTISYDPGPFIPKAFAGMILHMMQKEAVGSIKARAETQVEKSSQGKTADNKS